jgi:hypothetical protein
MAEDSTADPRGTSRAGGDTNHSSGGRTVTGSICHVVHDEHVGELNFSRSNVERLLASGSFVWIDLPRPTEEDLAVLRNVFHYLIMGFLGVELHFSHREGMVTAGEAFVMVSDAGRLWKRYRSQDAPGLGPVEDQPHGLREFLVTDPDGNRIRVGSPIPD